MKDTIEDEDLFIDTTKADIEKNLEKEKKARELLEDNFKAQQKQMRELNKKMKEPNKILNALFRDEEFVTFLKMRVKDID